MSRCVHVQIEVLVMSPPSLSLDNKMSTGVLFQHIIITFYHASAAKALSCRCVFTTKSADRWIWPHFNLFILHQVEDCQMKGNEETYMLGEELALFTHHHRDWSLHSCAFSIERYYIWNSCMFSLWNVYLTPHAAMQLGNMLHFIKRISSCPLTGLETSLFINEPFPTSFDFCTYRNKQRQAEIPTSSCTVHQDHCKLPQMYQTVRNSERI